MKPCVLTAAAAAGIAVLSVTISRAQTSPCSDGCFPARYWTVESNDYEKTGTPWFPEQTLLTDRADLGLAFSGGGTRSAAATVGALRGLHRNGWLSRVRYISAVSGGSWAAVPFVYSVLSNDELLGTMDDRNTSAESFLKRPNGALAAAIVKSSLFATGALEAGAIAAGLKRDDIEGRSVQARVALEAFFQVSNRLRRDPDRIDKTYTRLIGKVFIDPLLSPGANTSDQYFSWSGQSLSEIDHGAREQLGFPSLAHGGRPYVIASGTLVQTRALEEDASDIPFPQLASVEYTPLYVGVRGTFNVNVKDENGKDKTVRLGGGYVEPWVYDTEEVGTPTPADPTKVTWSGTQTVKIDPKRRFSLADVTASSGAAPQLLTITGGPVPDDYKSYVQEAAQVFPAFRHLSVASNTLTDAEVPHADGGTQDNLGVMPLLARQIRNVFVFINTNTKYWRYNDDLRSLFVSIGPPDGNGDKRDNALLQDSDPTRDAYEDVLAAFDKAQADGTPLVHCGRNWTVRKSEHYNVRGYTGLNICLFYNAQPASWADSLPEPVKADLPHEKNFPWFATFGQNRPHLIQLKAAQVNLLANMWAWIVTQDSVVRQIRSTMAPGVLP